MLKRSRSSTKGSVVRLSFWPAILLLWLGGSTASASEAIPLAKGEKAPFSGTLVPKDRLLKLGQKAERCEFLIEQNANMIKRLCDNDLRFVRKTHEIDMKKWQLRDEAMLWRLEQDFWNRPMFVVPVTAILTYVLLTTAKRLP